MKKKITCNKCSKRDKCKELCSAMIEILKNSHAVSLWESQQRHLYRQHDGSKRKTNQSQN